MKKQAQPQKTTPPVAEAKTGNIGLWLKLAAILLITWICYTPALSELKEFTNWDDDFYVAQQPLVKSLDADHVALMFKTSTYVMYNYHPLTMLSLAWDYSRGFDDTDNTLSIQPFVHTNILFHLLNTALVFLLIYRLSKKKFWAAAVAALLFGIHPMHVESVAWISERKDVLYCFFFLLGCLSYLRYIDTKKMGMLALTFILFLASCLSKPMAVPMPFVLLLLDYYERRKITVPVLLEKIPFVLISIWIGYITIQAQANVLKNSVSFGFGERIIYSFYGFVMYWVKLVVPTGLSAFYPYPQGGVPGYFYLAPVIALGIIILPIVLLRKQPERMRIAVFGLVFFMLMIALVLQFVSVGDALMADRYSYVAYIGPLFIIGMLVDALINNPKYRKMALGLTAIAVIAFGTITYARVQVWQNSETLWTNVIDQYPYKLKEEGGKVTVQQYGAKTAYKDLGDWYAERQQFDSALHYFKTLTDAGTDDAEVWSNYGNLMAIKGQVPQALEAFAKASTYDPENEDNYMKRGLLLFNMRKPAEALKEADKVLKINSTNKQAQELKAKCLQADTTNRH